jgi:uncharacterized membrane protein
VISTRDAAGFRLLLSRLLLVGVSAAAGLMVIGLLSALLVGWTGSLVGAGPVTHDVGDFSQTLAGVLDLRPFAIAQLGLLVLLATPVLRVATSVIAFAIEGDRLYALISGLVLAVLLTSIFLVR